jgi:hypothetical protein
MNNSQHLKEVIKLESGQCRRQNQYGHSTLYIVP